MESPYPGIEITIVNKGRRPLILTSFGGQYGPKQINWQLGDANIGHKLLENEPYIKRINWDDSGDLFTNGEDAHEASEFWFRDTLNRTHIVKGSRKTLQMYWAACARLNAEAKATSDKFEAQKVHNKFRF